MRPNKLTSAAAAVLWTLAVVMIVLSAILTGDSLGSMAVLLGLAASVPTWHLIVSAVVERSRTLLLTTLLDALERTERDVVQSIVRK